MVSSINMSNYIHEKVTLKILKVYLILSVQGTILLQMLVDVIL